ncbi:PAS domain S-box protein [Muricauda sp. CAU 1633]|uniref:PAS domain-containing sensor histidine kinase n=1 Tax=Allomuricauda sp. CAU 1633 TaxID=2816036 RepID=UPI001A8D37ED|nr:PAS domain S-box protein [Muricauda sp. CAU 1633]MBO0323615.1 PAS domain S-box protein [Muricauda sp. CAU 1633]
MTIDQSLYQKVPVPIALLGSRLTFVDFSDAWLEQFGLSRDIKGEPFFEIMSQLPEALRLDLNKCLEDAKERLGAGRLIFENGDAVWYDWKINTTKDSDDAVNGIILVLENVTDGKLEETLLKKAQKVARIGGWEVDLVKNKIYWSNITREIHEVAEGYIPNLEDGISFYKEGYSRETISKLVAKAIEEGKPWDAELQLVTDKRREIWVRAIGEPEMVNGKCVRITGTFQDIDKRKKAEIDYVNVSERHALATRAAGIGIWEYVIQGNQVVWDHNMYELYGIKESDFDGVYEAWEACVIPEDKERTAQEVNDAIEGTKDFNTTFRVQWPNGETRWIKAEAAVIRNEEGKALRMIGANEDITELMTTQMQLVKSEESLQGAFENSSIGMALVALDGTFIQVNKSLCKSLGYSSDELLNLTFQDITHPDDLEIDLAFLGELVDGKRSTYQIEKRYFDKEGQLVYVLLTVTAVRKIDGEISHFISQIVDISSRIKAEKKLKSLLQLTTNQNGSLLNFAHIVTHNLRSHAANLTMISGFLLDETLVGEERKDTLNMLGRASGGLNETISHLNEVVQVKLGTEKELNGIFLRKTIDKVLQDINALINENDVGIDIAVPKHIKIKGVPAYLESIVLNLVTNGIKYRNPEKKCHLKIEASELGQNYVFSVEDNGRGIDLDKYGQKLFGMYKTFHGNKDARGIGLFITKNQIESMGGTIKVESQIGVGTKFIIKFLKG